MSVNQLQMKESEASMSFVQPQQIPLNVRLRDEATFDNFYPGENALLIDSLQQALSEHNGQIFYLWGHGGSGKTHLLQAACNYVSEQNKAVVYIPLSDHEQLSTDMLVGLEHTACVCLDDIDSIAGDAEWEEALFHLFNRIRETKVSLIVTAENPPKTSNIKLPDLLSRLIWGQVYQIRHLDDEAKLEIVHKRANLRGLRLTDDVAKYLLSHCSRDMTSLVGVLEQLDTASLIAKRRVTIPFVKSVLHL